MGEEAITIKFDPDRLHLYEDEHLAMLLHVTQHNPASGFTSSKPGELAQKVKDEIVRRWLQTAPVELYHHQERHYLWEQLRKFAKFEPGSKNAMSPEWQDKGRWVPRTLDDETTGGEEDPGS